MLQVYVVNFMRVSSYLERSGRNTGVLKGYSELLADKETLLIFNDAVETIARDMDELDLSAMNDTIEHYRNRLKAGDMQYGEVSSAAREIFRIYQALIRKEIFVHIQPTKARYFNDPEVFGPDIATAFPTCYPEMIDAAECYAKEQDTACVMHLMRALELVLTTLAGKCGINTDREQWQNVIERIQKGVNAFGPADGPDWKAQQEFYSSACSHFMHFKNAWRNHAMHSRVRYNATDASRILDHVGQFMQLLSQPRENG